MRRWFLRASLRWQKSRSSGNDTSKNNSAIANPSQLSETIPMRSLAPQQASNPLSVETKVSRSLPPLPSSPQCCQQMPLRRSNSNQNRITKAKMKTIKLTLFPKDLLPVPFKITIVETREHVSSSARFIFITAWLEFESTVAR